MTKGSTYNQEAFLNRISQKLNRPQPKQVTRPAWSTAPQLNVLQGKTQDELVDVLTKQCESIHTDIVKTTNDQLADAVAQVISDQAAERIILSNEPQYEQYGLESLFSDKLLAEGSDVHIWDPDIGRENIAIAEKADIGITFSDMTLAESGTVVLFSDKYKGRAVSLLPTAYIAIIPKSTLVPRMTQATTDIHHRVAKGEITPACINFISGPSNSADIEMNLVVGVHGPVRATYIVIMDQ